MKQNWWLLLVLLVLPAAAILAGEPAGAQAPNASGPVVIKAEHFAVTPPLRDLPDFPVNPQPSNQMEEEEPHRLPKADFAHQHGIVYKDEALASPRRETMPEAMPAATTFAGQGNTTCGCQPPDTNGDVGLNYYVQTVNSGYAVFNKSTGAAVKSSTSLQTLWSSMSGSQCASTNSGDPIVLYDRAADRWLVSQFSLGAQYHQCVAVSQTNDPTGSWYTWDFLWSATVMNDYPHFGVWPDGYYMAVNQFTGGTAWAGQGVACFERSVMLTGGAGARMVKFDVGSGTSTNKLNYGGQLPSDLEGSTAPPGGMPNLFMEADDASFPGASQAALRIWKFHVDWTNTLNSTFGVGTTAHDPDFTVNCANFNYMPNCGTPSTPNGYCIPQRGTATKIDDLGDRLMHRVAYHNFGSYESLTANMTVDAGSQRAGIRWWELRSASTTPTIYQESTYAPADTLHRWMASVAMNKAGDLAVAYSTSDASTTYPSLSYAGRFAADSLSSLAEGEATMFAGTTYFSGNRWGDYSNLKVDPSDDCTFWYTSEYATGSHGWTTRIGSFKMVPLAPAAPSFSSVAGTTLTVNWGASGGAATYDVYRASGTSCAGAVKINASPVSGISYGDSGLAPSSPYSYYIVGADACGSSPGGSCATITTASASTPLRVPYSVTPAKITTGNHGTDGTVTFDKTDCSSTNYHILYGKGENLGTWTVDGGKCSIGASGSYGWTGLPDPSSYAKRFLWFLVVGDNGSTTEGSWGLTYPGGAEEGGASASSQCGCTTKDTSGACGTP